jgi:desulfoferrodoxin (superoxide reductase-like protein)
MFQDVLLFTQNIEEAKAEVKAKGGRITHKFSPEVFVAHIPQSLDVSRLQKSQASPLHQLKPTVKLAVEAWKSHVQKREITPSETEGIRWDAPGYQPPGYNN